MQVKIIVLHSKPNMNWKKPVQYWTEGMLMEEIEINFLWIVFLIYNFQEGSPDQLWAMSFPLLSKIELV